LSLFVAAFLAQDGLANGAVYCLLALALVLVFGVTRVILVPAGDLVSYAALSYALLRGGRVPGTVGLLLVLVAAAVVIGLVRGARRGELGATARDLARLCAPPLVLAGVGALAGRLALPAIVDAAVAVAVVAAMGPLLYRLVYRPLAGASSLVLLIVAVAHHLVMLGLGLYFFGPEGGQTDPLIDVSLSLGGVPVKAQNLVIWAACAVLIAGLWLLAERTLWGKALRAAAINPLGARLMGISADLAGETAFLIAAFIGGVAGVLISATTPVYYDSGFVLGLKGFVAAILGGLVSFPLAAAGAFGVGLLEAFSAFYASGFKETIVFALIIPMLLWRSLGARPTEDGE
jgi:branched-chain amino acid transport system permease protein